MLYYSTCGNCSSGNTAALLSSASLPELPFPAYLLPNSRLSQSSILCICYRNAVARVSRSLFSLLAVNDYILFIFPTCWLLTFFYFGGNAIILLQTGISWTIILLHYSILTTLLRFRLYGSLGSSSQGRVTPLRRTTGAISTLIRVAASSAIVLYYIA